jgi:pyruvate dehydrogenase E1 component alpha subunit
MYKRGETYSITSEEVDGQDVLAVREAMERALERARDDYQPSLLEIRTYRFMGHSMSDAVSGTYRTKVELEEYLKRDPINLFEAKMKAAGEITDAQIAEMEKEVAAVVQDAWDFADASPEPPPAALYEDVLVETTSG